jgi:pilus assembly protein CpaC
MSLTISRLSAVAAEYPAARLASKALAACLSLALVAISSGLPIASAQLAGPHQVVHKIEGPNNSLELIVNTSTILTLDGKVPRVQVNNPEILDATPLARNQVQISAKKPGVTQVNLWDDQDKVHSVDVIVYADGRELAMVLRSEFPKASLKVKPLANSVIISGYVDDPNQVMRIIQIAEDYHPKIINNITVGGVQQVLLQVKVMEVSRTKFRNAGFDWGSLSKRGDFAVNGVSGLLNTTAQQSGSSSGGLSTSLGRLMPGTSQNMNFGVLAGQESFFGVLNLLTQKSVAKVISEPSLNTVSGRPASVNVGGEFPILVPQSLGTVSIQYKKYGTQLDFVPIVLGNGAIRLEVRPRVTEIDSSLAVTINGTQVPALKTREADTSAELRAGETLAVAGLVQMRYEGSFNGLLGLSDLPFIGIPFRKVADQVNEVEMLILVTPQLVEAMGPHEVPPGGPGYASGVPSDNELYIKGHIEVPNCDGPNMMGPYPDARGRFNPTTGEPWDLPPAGATEIPLQPAAPQPAAPRTPSGPIGPFGPESAPSPPGPPSSASASGRSAFGVPKAAPRRTVNRTRTASMSQRRSPNASEVARQPSNRNKRPTSGGSSRRTAAPGFIGPSGYDLR